MSETVCEKCNSNKRVRVVDALGDHPMLCRVCTRALGLVMYEWPEYINLETSAVTKNVLSNWPLSGKVTITLSEAIGAALDRQRKQRELHVACLRAFRDRLDQWFDEKPAKRQKRGGA